jgi:hypothetical protein
MMRILIWILLSLGLLWGGYWFVGANALEKGLTSWLSDDGAHDWSVDYSELNTIGFPNRFDTTVRDIDISSQSGTLSWAAPFFQIFALSYKPNHIIAVWPNEQTITLPRDRLSITSDRMRGSAVFKPETALTLDRSDLEITKLAIQSSRGGKAAARALQFNTRQSPALENAHNVFFQTLGLRPSERIRTILDPKGDLPHDFKALRFDGNFEFDGPWDRLALEKKTPGLSNIVVNNLQIQWGNLDFAASGDLSVDGRGFLQGQLEVTAQNWQGVYRILKSAGLVQDNFFGAVESILMLMALETDEPNTLVATWVFQDGRMRFGAIPLGAAPRLVRR